MLLRAVDNLVDDRTVEPRLQWFRNLINLLLLPEIAASEKLWVGQEVQELIRNPARFFELEKEDFFPEE
jgi:hypothetical protein